jgi:hypothetical protein
MPLLPLQLELLAVTVGEQHVALGGGEGLQLLAAHHLPAQVRQLSLYLPLALRWKTLID